jgi:hypothetical protein
MRALETRSGRAAAYAERAAHGDPLLRAPRLRARDPSSTRPASPTARCGRPAQLNFRSGHHG